MEAKFPEDLINPPKEERIVNKPRIREISWEGFDDSPPENRLFAWLVEMGIYPGLTNEWEKRLQVYTNTYNHCIKLFGLENWLNFKEPLHLNFIDFGLKDNKTMQAIHMDVIRTGRQIYFLKPDPIENDNCKGDDDYLVNFRKHIRRMERIIYIFVSLNQWFSYHQGFNEILQPIYFVSAAAHETLKDDFDFGETVQFM